jgi:hypothetical protein
LLDALPIEFLVGGGRRVEVLVNIGAVHLAIPAGE